MGRMLFPAWAFKVEFPDLHSFESIDKSLESFLLPLLFWKVQGLVCRCWGVCLTNTKKKGRQGEEDRKKLRVWTCDIWFAGWWLGTNVKKLSCPAPPSGRQLRCFIRKTRNNYCVQTIWYRWKKAPRWSPSHLEYLLAASFAAFQLSTWGWCRGEHPGHALASRGSRCLQEAAPVFKGDFTCRAVTAGGKGPL